MSLIQYKATKIDICGSHCVDFEMCCCLWCDVEAW